MQYSLGLVMGSVLGNMCCDSPSRLPQGKWNLTILREMLWRGFRSTKPKVESVNTDLAGKKSDDDVPPERL